MVRSRSISRRLARPIAAIGLLGTLGLALAGGATAQSQPAELHYVCVDNKYQKVYYAVDPSACTSKETAYTLPQDHRSTSASTTSTARCATSPTRRACTDKERLLTIPDDGAFFVCAENLKSGKLLPRGKLRWVFSPSECAAGKETAYVTPAAPDAVNDDAYSVTEDGLLDVPPRGVLSNDSDLTPGASLTARLLTGTAPGVLSLRPDGSFQYDPRGKFEYLDEGVKAFDSFRYVASDGTLESAPATATITVVGRNDAPVAVNDSYQTDEDTVLTVPGLGVLSNDSDAESQPLRAILVTDVPRGELSLNDDSGSFSFDPKDDFDELAAGETATTSFTYLARDGTADSTIARVTITVTGRNDGPVAAVDGYTISENSVLTIAAPGVLGNDRDAESQPLHAELVANPPGGTLQLAANGSFTFDPRTAFDSLQSGQTAQAIFTYRAIDSQGGTSAPASVTITVIGISPPSAVDDARSTDEDHAVAIDVLANDALRGGTIASVEQGRGTAGTPNAAGVIDYDPSGAFDDLQVGESAVGTFRYTLTNEEGSSTATVRVTVGGRNDAPVAQGDDYTAGDGATLTVPAGTGVLANDTDAEDDPLHAVLVSPPAKGRVTLNANGGYTFTPAGDLGAGDVDTVTFSYRADDGRDESATATVTIHVNGVNDPPTVPDQTFSVEENSAAGTFVGNIAFTDPDPGQTHTFAILSGNAGGAFAIDSTSGRLTVASAAALDAEQTPFFDLAVRVTDSGNLSDTAVVRINVLGVDEQPVGADDHYDVVGNTELVTGAAAAHGAAFKRDPRTVLANDSDPEGGTLSVLPASGDTSQNGSYAIAANGGFSYQPPTGFTGADSFTYTFTDGTTQRTATVRLTVADMVWYVDGAAAFSGNGTSTSPFKSLAPIAGSTATDPDAPGDTIFLFAGTYAGPLALEDNQPVVGRGVDLVVGGTTLVTRTTAPLLTSSGAPAITVAKGNDLRGFAVSASGGAGITGSDIGTLTAALNSVAASGGPALNLADGTIQASIGSLTSSSSPGAALALTELAGSLTATTVNFSGSGASAVRVTDSTAAITLSGGSITSAAGGVAISGGNARIDVAANIATSGGRSVEVGGASTAAGGGCSVSIRGTVDDTGSGIALATNGGRICFSGRLTLRTGATEAFSAVNSPLTVTGTTNTIETTTGRGLRLTDVTVASEGIEFRRVSTNGAVNGIAIDGLSGAGAFEISGTGSPDTGGIVRGSSAAGVQIADAANVTLSGLRVTQSQGDGIVLDGTSNTSIRQSVVEDSGGYGLKGTNTRALNVTNGTTIQRSAREAAHLTNVLGSSSFATGVLRASHGNSHLVVRNNSATAPRPAAPADVLRLDSMRYEETVTTFVDAESRDEGNLQLQVGTPSSSIPSFMSGGETGVRARAYDGGRLDLAVTKLFRDRGSADAVNLEASGAAGGLDALLSFDVSGNNNDGGGRFSQTAGAAVRMVARTGGIVRGAIQNNVIAQPFGGGIVAVADGGRIEPDIGSNQITLPGCIDPGSQGNLCVPIATTPALICPGAPIPPGGIILTSQAGGSIAGAVRSNEIPDPHGGGIVSTAFADSSVDVQVTGNRIEQTLKCSLRGPDGFPIIARADGGTVDIDGGANTAILTPSGPHAIFVDALNGGVATADLAGDVARGGFDGVLGRVLADSELDIDIARLTRSDGSGQGVELHASGAGASLDFSVTDSDAAHDAGIRRTGGSGILVDASGGATATGEIEHNDVDRAAGDGIRVDADAAQIDARVAANAVTNAADHGIRVNANANAAQVDARVAANAVTSAGGDGIRVSADAAEVDAHVAANAVTSAGGDGIAVHGINASTYTQAAIEDNTVTNPLAGGIDVDLEGASTADGSIGGNTVQQTETGRLTEAPIRARADGGSLDLAATGGGNIVTLTDSASDAFVVEALGGAVVNAQLAGGSLTGGATGLNATATGASELEIETIGLTRSGGSGDAIHVAGADATPLLVSISGAVITDAGEDGIDVTGSAVDGTVSGNTITGAGGDGVSITGDLGDTSLISNQVSGVAGAPLSLHSSPSGIGPPRLDLVAAANIVDATGSLGDALGVDLDTSGSALISGNTITGALRGRGLGVDSGSGGQTVVVQSNSVQATSGIFAGMGFRAVGGTLCLDLVNNTSAVPTGPGFSLLATSAFGLSGRQFGESVADWVTRRGNTGTLEQTGSFSTCAA